VIKNEMKMDWYLEMVNEIMGQILSQPKIYKTNQFKTTIIPTYT